MIYLTYNDLPSGVFYSQVTDVCNYVNIQFKCNIKLVSLISIKGFIGNRKKIKNKFPKAFVLPMIPQHKNWRINKLIVKLLFLYIGKQDVWSRGIFATNIALDLKKRGWVKKIVFDARGAYNAEFEEYLHKIVTIKDNISILENNAILKSDLRLAVSNQLINYWKKTYNYSSINHVVIPCTLTDDITTARLPTELIALRNNLGIKTTDIVFVYSGSNADWQSFEFLSNFIAPYMALNPNIKLLLLSNINIDKLKITTQFSDRIIQRWLKPDEVANYLCSCDYGMLIREKSITNEVASPTKFAEYLNAGLKIIISENIGDLSLFVKNTNCGIVISDYNKMYSFNTLTVEERLANNKLSSSFFRKNNYTEQYKTIINTLS